MLPKLLGSCSWFRVLQLWVMHMVPTTKWRQVWSTNLGHILRVCLGFLVELTKASLKLKGRYDDWLPFLKPWFWNSWHSELIILGTPPHTDIFINLLPLKPQPCGRFLVVLTEGKLEIKRNQKAVFRDLVSFLNYAFVTQDTWYHVFESSTTRTCRYISFSFRERESF